MEISARYALVGFFIVSAIVGGFGFTYWVHGAGGLRERALYRVRFERPVPGLLVGSSVLFNGVRVGEVAELALDPARPRQVEATITVAAGTPVRADTQVGLDFQGWAGAPAILLAGGSETGERLQAVDKEPILLHADVASSQTLTQAAQGVLARIDGVLVENAKPLNEAIENLNAFTGVLARNSDRVDRIMAGLERMTGSVAKEKTPIYDLVAPASFPAIAGRLEDRLAIPEVSALMIFNTDRILTRDNRDEAPGPNGDALWSDNLPVLLQAKLLQAFENAGYMQLVSRQIEGTEATRQLLIEIRSFQVEKTPEPSAEVAFSARLVDATGAITAASLFHETAPANIDTPQGAVSALNEAFGRATVGLVRWTVETAGKQSKPDRDPDPDR